MDRPPAHQHRSRRTRRGLLAALAVACAATALYPAVHAAAAATAPLTVQYRTGTGPSADEAEPWFEIADNSGSAISLNQVTLRYYFSADTTGSYVFACAWAVVGCSTITGTVAALGNPTATADHYLQIAFTGGSIAAGATPVTSSCACTGPTGRTSTRQTTTPTWTRPRTRPTRT